MINLSNYFNTFTSIIWKYRNRVIVGLLLFIICIMCSQSYLMTKLMYTICGVVGLLEYMFTVKFSKNYVLSGLFIFIFAYIEMYFLDSQSLYKLVMINLLIAFTDVIQMIIGKSIGKIKISPISPKKTLEGYVGTFIFTLLLGYFMGKLKTYCLLYIIGCMGGVIMSAVKRKFNVKDYSNLLGDHGGFCDRFDSQFFTMIFVMTYMWIDKIYVFLTP